MCPVCKNPLSLIDGESVCLKCGYIGQPEQVQKEYATTTNVESRFNVSRKGTDEIDSTITKSFKNSYSKKTNVDISALKAAEQRSRGTSNRQRCWYKGVVEIEKMGKLLNLPLYLQNEVLKQYKLINQSNYLRSHNIPCSALALIVIVANDLGLPLSASEVLKHGNVARKKFNLQYHHLYNYFDKAPSIASSQAHYFKQLSYIKHLDQYERIKEESTIILEQLDFKNLRGRVGFVTAGTVIYLLLKYYHSTYLEEFLKKASINRLTIKNSLANLLQNHPYLQKYVLKNVDSRIPGSQSPA